MDINEITNQVMIEKVEKPEQKNNELKSYRR